MWCPAFCTDQSHPKIIFKFQSLCFKAMVLKFYNYLDLDGFLGKITTLS